MNPRILAYHRLSDHAAAGLESWAVRPAVFRRQMSLLKRLGYRGVSVRELLDAVDRRDSSEKLVGLSFDDGYRDTVESGLPVLVEFGFTASVYVVPDLVGTESSWEAPGKSAPLASWQELERLGEAGWEIGMHSRSHPPRFDLLTGRELELEVRDGLQLIQGRLGLAVETFAYPHGNVSPEAITAVQAAGYRAAVSCEPGTVSANASRFALPRYEIKRRDTLLEFAFLMLTGILPRRRETLRRFRPSRWLNAHCEDGPPSPAVGGAEDAGGRGRRAA